MDELHNKAMLSLFQGEPDLEMISSPVNNEAIASKTIYGNSGFPNAKLLQ